MKCFKYILLLLLFSNVSTFAQETVTIPNIITPNGDDINDVFSVRSNGFENLTCTIINRHGETVYRYFGLNGTWDGFTHAGVKVVPGVYFVLVELNKTDGSTENRQGTLQVHY